MSDTRGRQVITNTNSYFVDFHFQFAFKNKPVVLRLKSFHSIARFFRRKNFFCYRIYLHVGLQHLVLRKNISRRVQLFARSKLKKINSVFMNLEMMNESSKRHPKLSLIFTPNCLSKTSVTRMFVFYFSLKISRKTYYRIRLFP